MKKLVVIVLLVILTGCEKYVSGTHLTLSGKYLITRVSMISVDQNTTRDTVYYSGDIYKSQSNLSHQNLLIQSKLVKHSFIWMKC
jgi:hypothetical protein